MCYRFIKTQWKVVVKMFPCLSHDLLFPFLWIMLFLPWSFHLLCKKENRIKTTVKQRDKIWTFGPWTRVKCHPLFLESHPVPGSRHRSRLWPINNIFTLRLYPGPTPPILRIHARHFYLHNTARLTRVKIFIHWKKSLFQALPGVYFSHFFSGRKKAYSRLKQPRG